MRQYQYQATDATMDALRELRGAWTGFRVEPRSFTVRLADAREVRVHVDRADVEPELEAFRIGASVVEATDDVEHDRRSGAATGEPAPLQEAFDFAVGRNDIVLFTGATWIDAPPVPAREPEEEAPDDAGAERRPVVQPSAVQFSGHPGQIPETAAAVCLTTDALVVASPVGTGFLVRTGVRPSTLEVTDDAGRIAEFLALRGYGAA